MSHTRHTDHGEGVPSTAAIAGHPLHPMIVPFPIAFLVGALATDLVYAFWQSGDSFWARASLWLLGAGLATGVPAAILGLVDFLTIDRARAQRAGWVHFIGNAVVLATAGANLVLRLATDPLAAVAPWGLALSALAAALLMVTGWMGGELAYRHKIGVLPAAARPSRRVEPGNGRRKPAPANNRKRRS